MRIDGVDIIAPAFQFGFTKYVSFATVNNAYKANLANLTGKTNSDTFEGFAAGEVLFLGASGTVRGNDADWEISFSFSQQPNRTNITVGDISGISKKGWEYLWVRSRTVTRNELTVQEPVAVYVEKVYDSASFASLAP
jgi:hypothetical protein